eukprot:2239278-Pyramimonas_sp.AAC.1
MNCKVLRRGVGPRRRASRLCQRLPPPSHGRPTARGGRVGSGGSRVAGAPAFGRKHCFGP